MSAVHLRIRIFFIISITLVFFVGFAALGTWQVFRRTQKLALITHVQQRVHAPAVPAPGPSQWPRLHAKTDEYRSVTLSGHFLYNKETLVSTTTKLGMGFWVMTPLRLSDATTVFINRGFVPLQDVAHLTRPDATAHMPTVVTGLLRMPESGHRFLHPNMPARNQWYTRDVLAIADHQRLTQVAPYFIDAAANTLKTWPQGGMTVIAFPNNHLVYALTWYTLACMAAAAGVYVFTRKYEDYLRHKVEAGRASMNANRGRSNDEVEATFAARRSLD